MTAISAYSYRFLPLVALGLALGRAAADDSSQAGRSWSFEVSDALETYRAGDFLAAQRLATEVWSRSRDSGVRRDAAVIEALCLLRSPARADRVDGRTRLRQLAADDATLFDDPECNLAYGIAETELGETAEALDALDRAAAGFAQQKLPARQAAALVALADAWTRHADWDATPQRFGAPRPRDATEADEVRRAQIDALRPRIAALSDQDAALAELDLILAKHLLDGGDPAGQGLEILARLATAPKLAPATAEAALLLAQQYESNARWAEALRLYQRLGRDWQGDIARQAAQRAEEITRPQIAADVPGWVPCRQVVRAHVRVRGLEAVQVEVRQVDVNAWLGTSRSRISEAFLPESGSVRLVRELETRAAVEYGWWNSDKLETPLEFESGPGAYVLLVRGTDATGRAQVAKRLIVVSDLRAVCLAGSQHVVVWAMPPREGEAPAEPSSAAGQNGTTGASLSRLTGRFWMDHSFMPTEVTFDGTVARFALPAEARVMRDRGWVCLVRWGEQMAICRGSLPAAGPSRSAPHVALLASPPAPAIGDTLCISGLLSPAPAASPIELQVVDSLEDVQFTGTAEVPTAGAFALQVPITAELAGKHLRILARQGGRALENVLGRAVVAVPSGADPDFRVRVEVPPWLPVDATVLTGRVRAEYAWGMAPARLRARCVFRAVPLPTGGDEAPSDASGAELQARLDNDGQTTFTLPLADLGLPGRPRAIRVEARVRSWDAREGVGQAEVLVGPQRPQAWLLCTPARPMVGQEVHFRVGWFEPEGLLLEERPAVALQGRGRALARLPLHPGREGWTSAPWRFVEAGTYEAATSLAVRGAEPLLVNRTIEVSPAAASAPASTPAVQCQAQCVATAAREAVRVELDGQSDEPLLILAENGDPQAAAAVPGLAGRAVVLLPLEAGAASGLRVAVLSGGGASLKWPCAGDVAPVSLPGFGVKLTAPEREPWPGTEVAVRVSGAWPSGTALIARLINAIDAGFTEPIGDLPGRAAERSAAGLTVVSSAGGPVARGTMSLEAPENALGPMELRTAFTEGATLWSTSLPATGSSINLQVRIPAQPGLYKLIVAARAPLGQVASDTTILDARRGVRLEVNAPPRLTVGDRALVAVRVENAYAEPIQAQVRCEVGDELHVEALHFEPRRTGTGAPATHTRIDEPVTMDLPAGGCEWLYVDVEGTHAGAGRASAEVIARGTHSRAQRRYEVRSPPDSALPDATVHIQRTLVVWTAPSEADEEAAAARDEEVHWTSTPFSAATPLTPGQVLEVTEEFTLSAPLPELSWVQSVPPTCRSSRGQLPQTQPIGARQPDQAGAVIFKVPPLATGPHVHRYFLNVACPGAAVIPAPELRCGDRLLSTAVDPAEVRIVVPEVE
jgi:hypothetical protein